jgi:hypothetical protein
MRWEKRTEFIGGVPITSFEPVPTSDGGVDFDGGPRPLPPTPPRVEWRRDEGGWWTTTIDDGADLFFPDLRGR